MGRPDSEQYSKHANKQDPIASLQIAIYFRLAKLEPDISQPGQPDLALILNRSTDMLAINNSVLEKIQPQLS